MSRLALFEAFGIEIEYMIVDARSFDIRPISDRVLLDDGGMPTIEIEMGPLAWSNELVLHVLELKTAEPTRDLERAARWFQDDVERINCQLERHAARLLPGAMHPWMNPEQETRLWPHGQNEIYAAYDRIFDCRGHGWSNLQSMHLNLPFANDEEFGRLHNAIRALLPLLPALAASSPYADGKLQPSVDHRMQVYRHNSDRVPQVAGAIVPEAISTQRAYEHEILSPMYEAIAPLDSEHTLRHEWLNARGAIARFDRGSIEIRVLDVQECPRADLAIAAGIVSLLRVLTDPAHTDLTRLAKLSMDSLTSLLDATLRDAERARISDGEYLATLGLRAPEATAQEVWAALLETHPPPEASLRETLRQIVSQGPLGRRMVSLAGVHPEPARLRELAGLLATCLNEGELFLP